MLLYILIDKKFVINENKPWGRYPFEDHPHHCSPGEIEEELNV